MHWDDLKPMIWSAVGGAVAVLVIGFALAGWRSAGSADAYAMQVADEAVSDRLAAICAARAESDPAQEAKFVDLKKTDSWRRGDAVAKLGWATMPGDDTFNQTVADKCAALIMPAGS